MPKNSKIQWTSATWNPWHGCTKVSPGCKFCYMFRDKERYGADPNQVIRSIENFHKPFKWRDPQYIFTCSWSDFFHPAADEWREEAWKVISKTPEHTYQILTKRPERIHNNIPDWFEKLDNVWIGVSIESEDQLHRLNYLWDLPCITFASFEPLIGPITQTWIAYKVDWAIIGGESGNQTGKYRYRECRVEWIKKLIFIYNQVGRPVFVKQLGTWLAKEFDLKDRKGGDMSEWPLFLQMRQMPEKKML